MYKRVPPVFSLEYLRVFLNAIEKEGYNSEAIRKAIFDKRVKFEKEKFKATGRGFRLKTVKSKHLVKNCYMLCMQTGLLQRRNNDVSLSKESREFLSNELTHPKTKSMLLSKLLNTYTPFNEVLFSIRNQGEGGFLLPLGKEISLFESLADERYQLKVSKIQFQVVRDLLTQLGILNWRETKKDGLRSQMVYLIASTFRLSEVLDFLSQKKYKVKSTSIEVDRSRDFRISQFIREVTEGGRFSLKEVSSTDIITEAERKGYIITKLQETEDFLFIKNFSVNTANFEEVLWKEYLEISDYRSNYPVYYSELRDPVCERLRISDKTFDGLILRMVHKPYEYTVKLFPGGGPMPTRRGLSSMLKALPPKTGSDEYITFLKATK